MSNHEQAIALTAKMRDIRRFLKEHTPAETYAKKTSICRSMIADTIEKRGSANELDAAIEIMNLANAFGKEDQIGWVLSAAMDMIEEGQRHA